ALNSDGKCRLNRAVVEYLRLMKPRLFEQEASQMALPLSSSSSSAPKSTMSANEYARLLHCVLDMNNSSILTQITGSPTREQRDAAGSSGAYTSPWEAIRTMFGNADKKFEHAYLLDSRLRDINPNDFRIGRDSTDLKKLYNKIRGEFSLVYDNWCASGQMGSEDKEGRVDLADHLDRADDEATASPNYTASDTIKKFEPYAGNNIDKMMPFEKFGDRSTKCSPDALLYMHYFVMEQPSLLPMIVRILPTGSSHTEGGCKKTEDVPHVPRKRKPSMMSAKTIDLTSAVLISEEEKAMFVTKDFQLREESELAKVKKIQALVDLRDSFTEKPEIYARMDAAINKAVDEAFPRQE
ncbi:MAG: hypothetical protein ACREBR_02885, partial [bacterium]